MAQETPNRSWLFCSYLATRPLGQNTPLFAPYGAIMAQANVKEVIEVAPDSSAPVQGGTSALYLVRMVEQLTDEEGTVEASVSPDMNKVNTQQPKNPNPSGSSVSPMAVNARICRAYTFFTRPGSATVGPVAPAFVAGSPNEWVVMVQTFLSTGVVFRGDWSISVEQAEVAGNKVGGLGTMPLVQVPFTQA